MFSRIVCTFFLIFPVFSYGNQEIVESKEQVRELLNQIVELIEKRNDLSENELENQTIALFDKYLALDLVAPKIIGKKRWRKMNDAQKEKFLLLTEKYYSNIFYSSYSNLLESIKFSIVDGIDYHSPYKKGFLVSTEIPLGTKKQVFKIDFQLLRIKKTNHLKIVDIRIEGISLLINYRAAIKSMLRSHKGNIDAFLDELTLKL